MEKTPNGSPLVTQAEMDSAVAGLSEIPDAELVDMDTSPVTANEMQEAVDAIDLPSSNESSELMIPEPEVEEMDFEVLPPEEEVASAEKLKTEARIIEVQNELHEATADDIYERSHDGTDGGSDVVPPAEYSDVGYGGNEGGPRQPIVIHGVELHRKHGSDINVARKAFGEGFWGMLNMFFNPFAWRRYKKMMAEYEDDDLAEKVHTTDIIGGYTPNNTPEQRALRDASPEQLALEDTPHEPESPTIKNPSRLLE